MEPSAASSGETDGDGAAVGAGGVAGKRLSELTDVVCPFSCRSEALGQP